MKLPEHPSKNFPSAEEDAVRSDGVEARYAEGAYRLAYRDEAFLLREELRPVRIQLELLKPELIQQEQGIEHTVAVWGSARNLSAEVADAQLKALEAAAQGRDAADPQMARALYRAKVQVRHAQYYEAARRFGALVTERPFHGFDTPCTLVTGGGPGNMEAANRGAMEAGGTSIGLNIVLPMEQRPNPYITPELCFQFHYFAIRKMHFLLRARALVCFPGGFGTLDELFETLTLIQTGRSRRVPVLLYDEQFWKRLLNFDMLVEEGMISPEDIELFEYVESPEAAWSAIDEFYRCCGHHPAG
ncbi:MAG: TIGR00730 family Rossman fold protein [Pseudomonadota bacterium]|nr:TIGR00730 family Rossman fold protein [Pseudomonadota bacterium]